MPTSFIYAVDRHRLCWRGSGRCSAAATTKIRPRPNPFATPAPSALRSDEWRRHCALRADRPGCPATSVVLVPLLVAAHVAGRRAGTLSANARILVRRKSSFCRMRAQRPLPPSSARSPRAIWRPCSDLLGPNVLPHFEAAVDATRQQDPARRSRQQSSGSYPRCRNHSTARHRRRRLRALSPCVLSASRKISCAMRVRQDSQRRAGQD